MRTKRLPVVAALLLCPALSVCQETHRVRITAYFQWPQSLDSAIRATKMPTDRVEAFINSLRSGVPGYGPTQCATFRFAPLEKATFYLVASCGGRIESDVEIVAPGEHDHQFTEIESDSPLPLAMSIVDLDGDGADELVTGARPAGYMGASTPPIYWYTVWRFRDGKPEDASANFPGFYRNFVLEQPDYVGELLSRLQPVDPKEVRVPLAEIHYIHLKFERIILGNRNAGLEQALMWAKSRDVSFQVMGMSSLAEIPAESAEKELIELSQSPATRDLARAFLVKRARLLGRSK